MKPQPSSNILELQDTTSKTTIDSFYLIPCEWPDIIQGSNAQDSLYQLEEIMSKYKPCFIRHNGLVEALK